MNDVPFLIDENNFFQSIFYENQIKRWKLKYWPFKKLESYIAKTYF